MEANKKQYKPLNTKRVLSCLLWSIMVGFFLTITSSAFGQTFLGCNYKSGTFSMTLQGHTTGVGFASRLVLADSSGVIQYITAANSTIFQNVAAGNYLAYGITYENAVYIPNLVIGGNIKSVSSCFKTVVVPTKVCDCNNADGNLLTTSFNSPIGKQVSYVLTDGKGTILLIKSEPSFSGNADGVYNIATVTYNVGTLPMNFGIGKSILLVTGDNFLIEKWKGFVVCLVQNPVLSIIKNAPNMGVVGITYDYTLTIKNTGNVNTNGPIILTDTLAQGLSFLNTESSTTLGWSCNAEIIIVNNSARTLVSCQTANIINPNVTESVVFAVVTQRTGIFMNQAYIENGGTKGRVMSNIVETVIKDENVCKDICVPVIITKVKHKR